MAHYVRINNRLNNKAFDSINRAKKESSRLQKSGNTVSVTHHRTPNLHQCVGK